MLAVPEVLSVGEFNDKFEREFSFRTSTGKEAKLRQKIGTVTPYFVRLDSIEKVAWASVYLTREMQARSHSVDVDSHPGVQEKDGMEPPMRGPAFPLRRLLHPLRLVRHAERGAQNS